MRELDALISEYRHEKKRPREEEALFILRKVASLVKPIMRQRAWRVGALCEFYPTQKNLLGLNVNHGQKICLRLRYASDQRQFLPIEQVVDTMLHELCHIVHGPHDRQFHALWNQLRDEHEELVMKGYTGEGFLSQGKRLGGSRIPLDEARRRARAAAEQRKTLAKNSGKRLGGAPVLRGTDMRRLRADAAQRRIEVTSGCASGTAHSAGLAEEASRNGFRTKAEEEDANEQAILQAFIELIQEEEREKYGESYIPPSQENPAGPRTGERPDIDLTGPVENSQSGLSPEQMPETSSSAADNSSYDSPWTCTTCTLENPPNFLCCDVCAAERPVPSVEKPTITPRQHTPAVPSRPEPERSRKRVLQVDEAEERDEAPPRGGFAFKNRTRALDSLASIHRDTSKRPLGWLCDQCGSFMESQWWTCSCCGKMKPSS
ncbi:zinc metallopeptidase [Penicillium brasilianum]|uniref:Zinc metallopeptidase n=1 Tax=Penicillium brasilianum TaxID=104259 RepID=A0A1S9S1R4_PENBI|nr:zinc metallopeptidase [Penicillium brasilianum]